MHSYSPCSFWYVLECCCYCTFFQIQYFVIAILIWTCLTVFFLGTSSKYYIITSCISSFFVCYFDCGTAYFNVGDNRSIWCDCCHREWINVRPSAEYFLTICITCPSMAVCIICSLLYILEVTCCLNLILCYIYTVCFIIVCFRNNVVISACSITFTRKDNSCFITNNINTTDYRSLYLNIIYFNSLRTSVVLTSFFSCNCHSTSCFVFSYCVIGRINCHITILNCYCVTNRSDICSCEIKLINSPCKCITSINIIICVAAHRNNIYIEDFSFCSINNRCRISKCLICILWTNI